MKRLIFNFFLCFMMFGNTLGVYAQDIERTASDGHIEVVDGMTWYLKKKDAFKVAREQNKYVFLLWGRDICERCQDLRADVARCPIQPVIAKHYILWYADCDVYDREHPDVSDYFTSFPNGKIPLPVTCIINPADEKKAYGLQNGDYDVYELADMLDNTVGNDNIVNFGEEVNVFVYRNNIVVNSEIANEVISVYTIEGALVDRFRKTVDEVSRNISVYSGRILVITGSSGWTKKIAVK